jgi:hypothetical protein
VDSSDITTNNPSDIIIITPALPEGTYKLEITTQYGGNSKQPLKRLALLSLTGFLTGL